MKAEALILDTLAEAAEPMTADELAAAIGRSAAVVEGAIRRLESKARVVALRTADGGTADHWTIAGRDAPGFVAARTRSLTLSPARLRREHREPEPLFDGPPPDRPKRRADCADVPRPCPFVGCRHNLYLDVKGNGSIVIWRPWLEPHEVPPSESCALDIADAIRESGIEFSLDETGRLFNETRQSASAVSIRAISAIRDALTERP